MAFSTINKGSLYQNNVLYTGDGSTQAITGVSFQPDLVWLKRRDTTGSNMWIDAVRGVMERITSNGDDAEETQATGLTTFGADGFTLGGQVSYNGNLGTFVSWNWKANGAGSLNEVGDIDSTVSANTTSGFSIVTYTGNGTQPSTVGHGLGVVPKMIITKRLGGIEGWYCYQASMGNNKSIRLNDVAVNYTSANWSSTTPTTTVFTLGGGDTNTSDRTYVAYCFAEVSGFSKMGSYLGNANADGTFVYTGFRPSWVMIKGAVSGDGDAGQNWELYDNKREGYNPDNDQLTPSTNAAEGTEERIDLLSNGFKIRVNSDGVNDNDSTYIYMAFGQTLVGTNNIPTTAR